LHIAISLLNSDCGQNHPFVLHEHITYIQIQQINPNPSEALLNPIEQSRISNIAILLLHIISFSEPCRPFLLPAVACPFYEFGVNSTNIFMHFPLVPHPPSFLLCIDSLFRNGKKFEEKISASSAIHPAVAIALLTLLFF
jgi:hypothetical protein